MERQKYLIERFESNDQSFKFFDKLCDRAKQLILNALQHYDGMHYIYVCGLNEDWEKLTPIEQIFSIAFDLYHCTDAERYQLEIEAQENIEIDNKVYRVDFIIRSVIVGCEEKYFKKPLVIELDGHDYHSNKKQMQHDYERENQLKLNGYDVMRFTGSQIFEHPIMCVKKVYEYSKTIEFKEE